MTNLANREHLYRDLFDFRRDFDHIFNRFLNAWPSRSGSRVANYLQQIPFQP